MRMRRKSYKTLKRPLVALLVVVHQVVVEVLILITLGLLLRCLTELCQLTLVNLTEPLNLQKLKTRLQVQLRILCQQRALNLLLHQMIKALVVQHLRAIFHLTLMGSREQLFLEMLHHSVLKVLQTRLYHLMHSQLQSLSSVMLMSVHFPMGAQPLHLQSILMGLMHLTWLSLLTI